MRLKDHKGRGLILWTKTAPVYCHAFFRAILVSGIDNLQLSPGERLADLLFKYRQPFAVGMKMIGRHSYSSAWRDFHEIRPFGSILRRLQMPTIIAIQTLSFIRTKKFDEDLFGPTLPNRGLEGPPA